MISRKIYTLIAMLFFSLLCSCSCYNATNLAISNSSLEYGLYCSKCTQNMLVDYLRKRGCQVSFFGDDIYIIIHSKQLFSGKRTANLTNPSQYTLDLVAKFLLCYQKMTVKVIAYSNRMCTKKENLIFAKQRAQRVANALWKRGINSRLIYAVSGDVAKNPDSRGWVNRVEIITRRLP